MDEIRDDFKAGRLAMWDAFLALSDWARTQGFDPDDMTRLHGEFFDGNLGVKRSFNVALWMAAIRGWQ